MDLTSADGDHLKDGLPQICSAWAAAKEVLVHEAVRRGHIGRDRVDPLGCVKRDGAQEDGDEQGERHMGECVVDRAELRARGRLKQLQLQRVERVKRLE